MVAKVATYIFNELGFNVLLATDGVEALQILDKNPDISLLFTDIILPNGIDGKELATKIRNKIPSLPVIYTSGFTDGKLSKDDYQQFNTQFLQKPYTKNDLLLTINNISFDWAIYPNTVVAHRNLQFSFIYSVRIIRYKL